IALKKGVFFHDDPCFAGGKGREFNVDDVIFMIERICDPKTRSEMYGAFEGRLLGAKEFFVGKTKSIQGIRRIDNYTLELTLEKPLPRFVSVFADNKTSIVPRECVKKYGDDFRNRAVGTGPFLLQEANLASKVVAVRNPNYNHMTYPSEGNPGDAEKGLLTDAGKKLPLVDKVVLEIITESQPGWLKFLAGDFDIGRIPKDSVHSVINGESLSPEYAAKRIELSRQMKGDVTMLIFNMEDQLWGKQKELRQAVALALNVPEVIEMQYSKQAIRAHSLIDPTQYGYESGFQSKWANQNVALAKELLAKAGYPDAKGLPPIHFLNGTDTASRHLEGLLSKQFKAVGITLKPEGMTFPEMLRRVKDTGNFTFYGQAMVSTVSDADDSLASYHSKNIKSGYNPSRYNNPIVDQLIDEIEFMENGPERLAKIKKVQEIVDEDLPIIPMVHRIANQPSHYWLKNKVHIDETFYAFLKYLKIETANGP
ncbi:MAG TPA: ABC transporter substrate-binding protein, partial [Oligoflexia bacterium]|nr:ABC transporter substrate-binding protein [Oligoflexia bacterium]